MHLRLQRNKHSIHVRICSILRINLWQAWRNRSGWSGPDPTNFWVFGQGFWRAAPLKANYYDFRPLFECIPLIDQFFKYWKWLLPDFYLLNCTKSESSIYNIALFWLCSSWCSLCFLLLLGWPDHVKIASAGPVWGNNFESNLVNKCQSLFA